MLTTADQCGQNTVGVSDGGWAVGVSDGGGAVGVSDGGWAVGVSYGGGAVGVSDGGGAVGVSDGGGEVGVSDGGGAVGVSDGGGAVGVSDGGEAVGVSGGEAVGVSDGGGAVGVSDGGGEVGVSDGDRYLFSSLSISALDPIHKNIHVTTMIHVDSIVSPCAAIHNVTTYTITKKFHYLYLSQQSEHRIAGSLVSVLWYTKHRLGGHLHCPERRYAFQELWTH